jgi:hypothetical protein
VNLSHLSSLTDAVQHRRPNAKPAPRIIERRAKVTADAKAEKAAKAERWKICGGRCEWRLKTGGISLGVRCNRRIERAGLDSLRRAICHHVIFRSHLKPADKWKVENLRYICHDCDEAIHRGGRR